jgi:hypothetical protein
MGKPLTIKKRYTVLEYIFYSNYFYGFCAVTLSIEAALQQRFPLNDPAYYVIAFMVTILYYTYPYARKTSPGSANPRTRWYHRHFTLIWWNQVIFTLLLLAAFVLFLWNYQNEISLISSFEWFVIFIFPAVAALYYGINVLSVKYNLRKIGWLKPFIIGFTWAGLVTTYPILFYCIVNKIDYQLTFIGGLLFLKNLMFVAVLCIMFDIKDYATDYTYRISTFVVKIGLRKTIFFVLLPLSLLGLLTFLAYAISHQFLPGKILLNTIPFACLIAAGYSLRRRRPLLYYLVVIDGLMLVKAACGILAMLYF